MQRQRPGLRYRKEETEIAIYVTGDCHGDFSKLINFAKSDGRALTKNDYVIVLGDFGIWPETMAEIEKLDEQLNYTLMFLDGNHEHFPTLDRFPKKMMLGGEVRDIFGVCHLPRSQILQIPTEQGNTVRIAVCGGGDSRDWQKRTEGVDWFPQERITDEDVTALLNRAEEFDMEVDYFLSHSLSAAVKAELHYQCAQLPFYKGGYIPTDSDCRIRDIVGSLNAKKYLSGHEHIDQTFSFGGKNYRSMFRDFVQL